VLNSSNSQSWSTNGSRHLFSFQLKQLKLDLRDVLYSHKWTPDAFLLARAYILDEDRNEQRRSPNIAAAAGKTHAPLTHITRKL